MFLVFCIFCFFYIFLLLYSILCCGYFFLTFWCMVFVMWLGWRWLFELAGAVGLAQEHAAAELGRGEAAGPGQLLLAHDLAEIGPGIGVVRRKTLQDRGQGGSEVAAAAPGVEYASLIVPLDELLRAPVLEVAVEEQRRVGGIGGVSRVQADIADDVVDPPVPVEVRGRDRGPPSGAGRGEAGPLGPVLKALALAVVEIPDASPVQRENQVRPAVPVDVGPQGRGHHPDLAKPRRKAVGHVLELSPAVGEELAPRGERI